MGDVVPLLCCPVFRLECFAGMGVVGLRGELCLVISLGITVLSQVFPPIPMKPIYSGHTRIRIKHLLLPSEEKPCPAYVAPLKSKCMIWWGKWRQAVTLMLFLLCICDISRSRGSAPPAHLL